MTDSTLAGHRALVDKLKMEGAVTDERIEAAFRAVPRHIFLPDLPPEETYRDSAITTKREAGIPVSSSSQPTIMAIMLEQLAVQPGQRVLEIGAGTGYNAALLAHLAGIEGEVSTVDIDEDLVLDARRHLAAVGLERVRVVCADGGLGLVEAAPFDRVILTVGAWDITPAWFQQLVENGRLVLPLSLRGFQMSACLRRLPDHLESISLESCGFMRLRGTFAAAEGEIALGPDGDVLVTVDDRSRVNADNLYTLLQCPQHSEPLHVQSRPPELWGGLVPWLAAHSPLFCTVVAERRAVEQEVVPDLFGTRQSAHRCTSAGLLGEKSLCLLTQSARSFGWSVPSLHLRTYGGDEGLARQLRASVMDWKAHGRPRTSNLHLNAYPKTVALPVDPGVTVIAKQWTNLALRWESL